MTSIWIDPIGSLHAKYIGIWLLYKFDIWYCTNWDMLIVHDTWDLNEKNGKLARYPNARNRYLKIMGNEGRPKEVTKFPDVLPREMKAGPKWSRSFLHVTIRSFSTCYQGKWRQAQSGHEVSCTSRSDSVSWIEGIDPR